MAHYFYTYPSSIDDSASPADFDYGPQVGFGSADSFRPSQFLKITENPTAPNTAPAFAVCNGQIRLQSDNNGTYTLILRPHMQPPFDFPEVKYYIYRGIDRAILLVDNKLNPNADIPFIENALEAYEVEHGDNTPDLHQSDFAQHVLGLSLAPNGPYSGYEDLDSLDNLFEYYEPVQSSGRKQTTQAPFVKAGEKIGEFLDVAGFEIILNRLEAPRPLSHVREHDPKYQILPPAPDDKGFDKVYNREQCLSHIDPCAFYGSFFNRKLLFWDESGYANKKPKRITPSTGIQAITNVFPHPHRVYLDFRNDYGTSLSLFNTHPTDIEIEGPSGNLALPNDWQGWPIRVIEFANISGAGTQKGPHFQTTLKFAPSHADAETNAVLYLSRAYRNRARKLWPHQKVVSGLSTPLSLPLNGPTELCAGYFKINIYDLKRDNAPGQSGWNSDAYAPNKDSYINGLFRPNDLFDTPQYGEASTRVHTNEVNQLSRTGRDLSVKIWNEEVLVNLAEIGGPCYVAKVGIAQDDKTITVFAVPEFFIQDAFRKKAAPSFKPWLSSSENLWPKDGQKPFFLEYLAERSAHQEVRSIDVTASAPSNLIVAQDSDDGNRESIFRVNGRLEHGVFITLSREGSSSELETLQMKLNVLQPSFFVGLDEQGPVFWSQSVPAGGTEKLQNTDQSLTYLKRVLQLRAWKPFAQNNPSPNTQLHTQPVTEVYEIANS